MLHVPVEPVCKYVRFMGYLDSRVMALDKTRRAEDWRTEGSVISRSKSFDVDPLRSDLSLEF